MLFTVVPTALATAMDVNLSNASLVSVSVTFATMVSYYALFLSGSFFYEVPFIRFFVNSIMVP